MIEDMTDPFEILNVIGNAECNICTRHNVFSDFQIEGNEMTFSVYGYALCENYFTDKWQKRMNNFLLEETNEEIDNKFIYQVRIIKR